MAEERRKLYDLLQVSTDANDQEISNSYGILRANLLRNQELSKDERTEQVQQLDYAYDQLSKTVKSDGYDRQGNTERFVGTPPSSRIIQSTKKSWKPGIAGSFTIIGCFLCMVTWGTVLHLVGLSAANAVL